MCMIVDEDYWAVYDATDRRARKQHVCGECGRRIAPGEVYNAAGGLDSYGSGWHHHKTCAHCDTAARWLHVVCGGWCFGARREDLGEHVVGHESWLRSAPLTRLYRWMSAGWRDRDGDLRSVEDVQALTDRAIAAYHATVEPAA